MINVQLIDQINKLKSQIETNKIFTYMIIHDLKHPTESLIDSLQFVMGSLKKLENSLNQLSDSSKDIQNVNELSKLKLQEMRAQIESVKSELNDVVNSSRNGSQEIRQNLFNNN